MIACDPNQTCDVWLADDADRPEAERPTLTYRHFTARETVERAQRFDRTVTLTDEAERLDALAGALAVGLVGWRNVTDPAGEPLAFDVANLARAFTLMEMGELYAEAGARTRLAEAEKKSSRSAATSGPTSSAPNAAAPAGA